MGKFQIWKSFLLWNLTVVLVVLSSPLDYPDDYYDDLTTEETSPSPAPTGCHDGNCKLPDCSCFHDLPKNIPVRQLPQFVMLTFDDAVSVANMATYKRIMRWDPQRIRMTFFVTHEYNDYALTNELYRKGHEIAVHSVTHESNTDLWRNSTEGKWKKEMVGMRTMLKTFAGIPEGEITGHRAPFLQTAGDNTFRVLSKEKFLYDSSMPTRSYRNPPLWPYTLDHGYGQDCQIQPCPKENHKGLWIVPMTQFSRESHEGEFLCSMIDACTPYPETPEDTRDYLMMNFERHYKANKAPFPVFLHEAWLRDKHRLEGYKQFLQELLSKPDVFIVSVRSVVEYMRNPVPYEEYRLRQNPPQLEKCQDIQECTYKTPNRNMRSCVSCPPYYPWLGTPLGRRPPEGIK